MSEILTTILRGAIDDMQTKLSEATLALNGAELLRKSVSLLSSDYWFALPNDRIKRAWEGSPLKSDGLFREAMVLGFQLKADELDKKALACVNAIAQRAGMGVDEVTIEVTIEVTTESEKS